MKNLFLLSLLFTFCSGFLNSNAESGNSSTRSIISNSDDLESSRSNEITILFAYTTRAAAEVGGPKNIKKNVVNGMKLLNEALINNNIGYRAVMIPEFVHIKDNTKNTADIITEFSKPDGEYCQVHKFRKQKQADIVCLIFDGGKTSKGMLNGDVMVVTAKGAWDGSYIFPHEFGHVMGCKHETGALVYEFGASPYPYRTVSNNGGISLPYFSENRVVSHTIDGVTKQIRLGDANHDNAAIIRKNAPQKSALGENLPPLSSCWGRYQTELVNPDNAPNPPGTLTPFELKEFNWNIAGNVNMKWEASIDFAKTYPEFKIKYFDDKGNPNNWLGSRNGFINPGRPYDGSYTTYRPDKITPASKIELWIKEDGGDFELAAYSIIGGESKILKQNPTEDTPIGPTGGVILTEIPTQDKFKKGEKICIDGKTSGTVHSNEGNDYYMIAKDKERTIASFHSSRLTAGNCATAPVNNGNTQGLKKGDKVCIKGEINGEVADISIDGLVAVGYGYDNVFVIEWYNTNEVRKGFCKGDNTGNGYINNKGEFVNTKPTISTYSEFKVGDKVCVDGIFQGEVRSAPNAMYVSVYWTEGNVQAIDIYTADRLTKGACAPGGNNGVKPGYSGGSIPDNNTLLAGEKLNADGGLTSGGYTAKMQADGNFVVYDQRKSPQWATGTQGKASTGHLIMQTDGNLVIYDVEGRAVWSSQTHPFFDSKFANPEWKPIKMVLEGRRVYLYSATGRIVWASKTGNINGASGKVKQKRNTNNTVNPNTGNPNTDNSNNGSTSSDELPDGYGKIKGYIDCAGNSYCRSYDNTLFIKESGQWKRVLSNVTDVSCTFTPGKPESQKFWVTQNGNKYEYKPASTGGFVPK